jgi:PDZ domain-containing secreted protein
LFGVSKASTGEFHSGDKILFELSDESAEIQSFRDSNSDINYHSFSGIFSPGTNKIPVFKKKLKNSGFYLTGNEIFARYTALFSRPPPCIS